MIRSRHVNKPSLNRGWHHFRQFDQWYIYDHSAECMRVSRVFMRPEEAYRMMQDPLCVDYLAVLHTATLTH